MVTHSMVLTSDHYRFIKNQTSPFKLIVLNSDHQVGDRIEISEINSITHERTGFNTTFEILKFHVIEHNLTTPSYLWLTVQALACHSSQKSNF